MVGASAPDKSRGLGGGIGASMLCTGIAGPEARVGETSVEGVEASGGLRPLAWAMTSKPFGRLGGIDGGAAPLAEGEGEMAEMFPSTKVSSTCAAGGEGIAVEGLIIVCAKSKGTDVPLGV